MKVFKRILSQFLASMAKNLITVNAALFAGLTSILIPSLLGTSKDLNPDETLRISPSQASWLPTISIIGHPLGSVVSGRMCDAFGRRKGMMLVTLPILIMFCMLSFSKSFETICIGFAVLGFAFGLKEAPTITYVGEISEPSIRGILMSFGAVAATLGIFIVFLLGSFFSWRQVTLICSSLPIMILISVYFIPESPIWLLSKNRPNDAQKSLSWLRGWRKPEDVHDEFIELQRYAETSKSCSSCAKQSIKCNHPEATLLTKIKELKRKRSLKPFILVILLQLFFQFSLEVVWTPYIIQVLKAHGVPIQANKTTVIMSVVGFIANISLLLCVKTLGKRKICLCSYFMMVASCIGLGIYGFTFFPQGWTSFESHSNPNSSESFERIRESVGNYGYLALILILNLQFFTRLGAAGPTYCLVGEVFPFKVRSFLSGITASCRYIFASISTKMYYDIEMWLSLPGAILFYGAISLTGFVVLHFILPETEQRSLEDIELHYSDNSKGITDIDIAINDKNTN